MPPTIAIVGRPNVGKSTLFNHLIRKRKAIVDDRSGITRDRLHEEVQWDEQMYTLLDTGGFTPQSDDTIEQTVQQQVQMALEEATLLLFVVDVRTGITQLDKQLSQRLLKSGKPVLLVVNKADNESYESDAMSFYGLGFEHLFAVSATNGRGIDLLKEHITTHYEGTPPKTGTDLPRLSVVGRPNVGKSSYINALLGEERNIVTEIPGTTRDSTLTRYRAFGEEFYLVDTGGLRKKKKVNEDIEYYATLRTHKALEQSDVVFLMLDGLRGIQAQDLSIFKRIKELKKGVVILVSKWDLLPQEAELAEDFTTIIKNRIAPFNDVPILYISNTQKKRVYKSLEIALQVYDNQFQKVSTSELNDKLLPEIEAYPPPSSANKLIEIKYITQIGTAPPRFAFFANHPQLIQQSYQRFLENKIREHFEFSGVPIQLVMKKK